MTLQFLELEERKYNEQKCVNWTDKIIDSLYSFYLWPKSWNPIWKQSKMLKPKQMSPFDRDFAENVQLVVFNILTAS